MHPLIARIHPALRTAFFAWVVSRCLLWLLRPERTQQLADGAPFPGLVDRLVDTAYTAQMTEAMAAVLSAVPWVGVELAILAAGVSVYQFARDTELPRIAEGACWLWMFNPVLAMVDLGWGTQLAAATGAIAVSGFATGRHRRGLVACAVAAGCRVEFIIAWPAIAWAIWRRRRQRGGSPMKAMGTIVAIPTCFVAWIGITWHLAGTAGISLRGLHDEAAWRTASQLFPQSTPQLLLIVAVATALVVALRYARRFPGWYTLLTICALMWPLIHLPASFGAVAVAWALPTFVHFSTLADDTAVERPLLAGLVAAFAAVCAIG